VELTDEARELLVERLVSEGTSESSSEESSSESMFCSAKRRLSSSRVVLSYWVLMTWRVWPGRWGLGAAMREGERERPLATLAVETRRDLRSAEDDEVLAAGMSRMLSLRPVVGSVVCSLAGSWETWYPSMM